MFITQWNPPHEIASPPMGLRFYLLQPVGMEAESLALRRLPDMSAIPIHLEVCLEMTEVGAFAALFEDNLDSLSLEESPRSDKAAPDFLNWSRFATPKQLLDLVKAKTTVKIK